MQRVEPYGFQAFNNDSSANRIQGNEFTFEAEKFFTLESTPAVNYSYNSPSVASNASPFSPQNSHSYASDHHHSSDTTYGSPLSGSSGVEDDDKLMQALLELKNDLLGPESDFDDSGFFDGNVLQPTRFTRYDQILEIAPRMELKKLLVTCAQILSEAESFPIFSERMSAVSAAETIMAMLEKRVSVSGEPLERLSAYMLEGLRARVLSSGSIIYKKLKCKEPTSLPTSSELMSYMGVLYQICPYYKFAYMSANVAIGEAMENENRIHIIDFQIAQGSQWIPLIHALSRRRPNGPPCIRITGVDDSDSAHARGGGLELVGKKLEEEARSCGVPFQFHGAGMSGNEVQLEDLNIHYGEALAVNFPYILHHMPDESVSTINHRDRLLHLVKRLSPKVVTLVEQESNTNTGTFYKRFCETLEYYMAMFESIDAARDRVDRLRINAEEHCVAKDVVNIIACEGIERVERHEPFGKWRSRLMMAGFVPVQMSQSASNVVRDMLKEFSPNFGMAEANGALYLGWKNKIMATSSAWK